MNPFLTIRGKLLTVIFCTSFIPITVSTLVHYFHARSSLKSQVLDQLKAVAESKRLHVRTFMEIKKVRTADFSSDGYIRNNLETIARGNTFAQRRTLTLNKYLSEKKLILDRHLISIVIVGKDGKVISSTNKKFLGKDMSNQEVFIRGKSMKYGETFIMPRYASSIAGNCILSAAPIISHQGTEFLGIIITAYHLTGLNEITTNRVGMGETGEVYLVNREKIIITESRFIGRAPHHLTVNTEPTRTIVESNKEMVGTYPDYRGVPVIGASMDIPEYGWLLLAEIDEAEAFASVKILGVVALILGVVSTAVAIGVGALFTTSLSMTIKDFTHLTKSFVSGALGYRLMVNRKDEMGILASCFNTLADELTKEITEHKQITDALRKNKERSEAIMDNTTAVIYLKDTDGRYLLINQQFEKLFHMTKEQVVGKTDYDIFPKENADAFRLNDRKVLETRSSLVINEIAPHDDGMHTYISLKFPMYDSVEGLYGVCGISTDITESLQRKI